MKDVRGCPLTGLGELTLPGLERPPAFRAFFIGTAGGAYLRARSNSVSSHRPNISPTAISTSSLIFFRSVFFRSVVHTPLGTVNTKLLADPAEKNFPEKPFMHPPGLSGLDYPASLGEMCA
ncbi:MAG: hypothetical protein SGI90_13295 [Candidatus Eisenbacteria bacterium]|nr:hypothetical protein [Candidatus Eisenbacteria bacterium]